MTPESFTQRLDMYMRHEQFRLLAHTYTHNFETAIILDKKDQRLIIEQVHCGAKGADTVAVPLGILRQVREDIFGCPPTTPTIQVRSLRTLGDFTPYDEQLVGDRVVVLAGTPGNCVGFVESKDAELHLRIFWSAVLNSYVDEADGQRKSKIFTDWEDNTVSPDDVEFVGTGGL